MGVRRREEGFGGVSACGASAWSRVVAVWPSRIEMDVGVNDDAVRMP